MFILLLSCEQTKDENPSSSEVFFCVRYYVRLLSLRKGLSFLIISCLTVLLLFNNAIFHVLSVTEKKSVLRCVCACSSHSQGHWYLHSALLGPIDLLFQLRPPKCMELGHGLLLLRCGWNILFFNAPALPCV